jgi:AraC-like DNA-binding protein
MLYLAHIPAAPLRRLVRLLWYTRMPPLDHRRQRILPSGCAQVILSFSRDFLLDCPEGLPEQFTAPALVVGQRSAYEIIDTSDLADLMGIVFAPGVLSLIVGDRADVFSNRSVGLEQVWGGQGRTLRDRLREVSSPQDRLQYLEQFLLARLAPRLDQSSFALHPAVEFALRRFEQAPAVTTVSDVASDTGWSNRRFSQIFREQVGFAPKTWCRLARFQRAVRQLHAGLAIPWAEVAVECGFYDQAHCANEFRAFSGIDIRTYRSNRNPLWANHVRAD